MSAVYQSFDVVSGRPVAVKLLADHLASQPEFVGRFYREARLSRVLEHPNIVQGYASGYDPHVSKHFLVLEFIDGPTTHGVLAHSGKLNVGAVVRIGIDIARALKFLHERQYVHRDVKPDNILLHPDGIAKLADLGLAKRLNDDAQLTSVHQGVGTTYYMPYEQAVNANLVDGRSDIFALGATLYHLLTGEVPFPGATHDEVIREKAHNSFRSLRSLNTDVPSELEGIISAMLEYDPRARIQSANELIEALDNTQLAGGLTGFGRNESSPVEDFPHPTEDSPTRIDHRLLQTPPDDLPPPLPPPGDGFTSATWTIAPIRSAPHQAPRCVWPWVVGTGAVIITLVASAMTRQRDTPVPDPETPAILVKEPVSSSPVGLPALPSQ
ncbi:MAG: serine/threonine protein kinase [Planctomycetia bacterium]|nr:serine/threonine protein kinase [Planctomycetia bacterium]